jgi:hypothetical protein
VKIALSGEQRQDAEKLLADVTAKQRTVETVHTECDATQALLDANDKRAAVLIHDSTLSDANVLELVTCERKALLLADQLADLQAQLASAQAAVAQAVQPAPDLLQAIFAPVLDGLVDEIAHALLPQFGDAALARNAAMQTERVAKFQRFTRCDWRVFDAGTVAPALCEWLQRLLAGELPSELQP